MKKIIVNLPGKSYPIFIGEEVTSRIKREMNQPFNKVIIIDKNVEKLHGTRIRNILL